MSDVYIASLADQPAVVSGTFRRNRSGNWTVIADRIDTESAISGQVVIRWLNVELRGYVERSDTTQGFAAAIIRGGAGGIAKQLQPKMYDFQVNAGIVANDIVSEAGERLSAGSALVLSSALSSWVRRSGTAAAQLDQLCDAIGAVWRVELDGSILLSRDTFAPIAGWDHDIPQDGWHARYNALRVISNEVSAAPGSGYIGDLPDLTSMRNIVSVCYCTGDGPECWLYFAPPDQPTADNEAEPLRRFIRETMRETQNLVTLSGRAAVQRADGSVDVYPDDKRLPALTNCIVRPPVPGGRVTINPGTQVVIVFENGDPRQRVVIAYGQGSPTYPMALVNDGVNVGTLTISNTVAGNPPTGPNGAITFAYVNGNGQTIGSPVVITIAAGLITQVTTPAGAVWPLTGKITGPGSQVLKSI